MLQVPPADLDLLGRFLFGFTPPLDFERAFRLLERFGLGVPEPPALAERFLERLLAFDLGLDFDLERLRLRFPPPSDGQTQADRDLDLLLRRLLDDFLAGAVELADLERFLRLPPLFVAPPQELADRDRFFRLGTDATLALLRFSLLGIKPHSAVKISLQSSSSVGDMITY